MNLTVKKSFTIVFEQFEDDDYRSLLGSAGASFSSSIGSTSANPDRRKNPGPS